MRKLIMHAMNNKKININVKNNKSMQKKLEKY